MTLAWEQVGDAGYWYFGRDVLAMELTAQLRGVSALWWISGRGDEDEVMVSGEASTLAQAQAECVAKYRELLSRDLFLLGPGP